MTIRFALLLGLLAAALPATAETGVVLRSSVIVAGPTIRLADLFEGELANPETAVAKAPVPGASMVLEPDWIAAVARAYRVAWQPKSRYEQVTVMRASQRVGAPEIKAVLLAALVERGFGTGESELIDVTLDGPDPFIELPTDVPATLGIEKLSLDTDSGRFTALLVAPAEAADAVRRGISGRAFQLVEIPVPVRRLVPGERIGEDDVEWARQRADRLGANVATELDEILGLEPRRPLRAGEPVRTSDLQTAIAVKKGALVTVVLQTAQLTVTVQGKAMDSGALGETIRVANTKSNRLLNATILDSTTVTVAAGY